MRRGLNIKRIGHSGTLDPLARGLMVVGVGSATRFLQYLSLEPKVYRASVTFGGETDTFDAESVVMNPRPVPTDLSDRLNNIFPNYVGEISQLPPRYSAVKVNGRALYSYARAGEEVVRTPRTVFIDEISVLSVHNSTVEIEVTCSGGTYIRTLAHDLGQEAGCGAYLSHLVRTRVGKFSLDGGARPPDQISQEDLIPLAIALDDLPTRALSLRESELVQHGNAVPLKEELQHLDQGDFASLLNLNGEVVAMSSRIGNVLQPQCVIPVKDSAAHLTK
jgi:tRNA pseudouridine55 synthase